MKNYFLLFLLGFGVLSCSSNSEIGSDNADLVGKWSWTNTDGGLGFHIHETPESTGTTFQLILNKDFRYSFLQDGEEISSGTYKVTFQKSNLTNDRERFISYTNDFEQPSGIVVTGMISTSADSHKLSVAQDWPDGIGSGFKKMQ